MIKENYWIEELIWCPSQCYYYFQNLKDNQNYCIYLRWRHRDPWTTELIKCDDSWEFLHGEDDWEYIETGKNYCDEEYRELEEDILKIMRNRFPGINFKNQIYEEETEK